jgi:hypothetical protein
MQTDRARNPWHPAWAIGLGLLALVTIGIQHVQPVRDTDLWWQMAYGRYMLDHHTLIPDHSAFTWTPAANTTVYCAWLTEILLYRLYQLGGLVPLYGLVFVSLLVFLATITHFARRLRVLTHPVTGLVALLAVLMSDTALYMKPEIFSFVFMTLAVASWLHIKTAGERAWRWVYVFPALLLVWVNSHGGVIFGVLFLAVMGGGEWLNARYSPTIALPARVRRHLWIALALCVPAFLLTPYGVRYPLYLVPALASKDMEIMRTVRAYLSIFDPRAEHLYFPQLLAAAALILAAGLWGRLRRRRIDWALLGLNAVFAFLFTRLLRTTYYWAPVFALSVVHLLGAREGPLWPKRRPAALALAAGVALVAIFASGRETYDAVIHPGGARWVGFGVSYHSPVEEAEYIRRYFPDRRLGNDYAAGGYMLWALGPETKVMIDARQFPFYDWYKRYMDFSDGKEVDAFLRDFPFEVGCFSLNHQALVAWFLKSPDWKLAFYGRVAAVFVRRDIPLPPDAPRVSAGIADIKNLSQALLVSRHAIAINDWPNAQRVAASMQARFRWPAQRRMVRDVADMLAGQEAYFRGDYETAARLLQLCQADAVISDPALLLRTYNHLTIFAWKEGKGRAALAAAEAALAIRPDDSKSLYNAGVIEWYLETAQGQTRRATAFDQGPKWPQRLREFIADARRHPPASPSMVTDAESMLAGTCTKRPRPVADQPLSPRGEE